MMSFSGKGQVAAMTFKAFMKRPRAKAHIRPPSRLRPPGTLRGCQLTPTLLHRSPVALPLPLAYTLQLPSIGRLLSYLALPSEVTYQGNSPLSRSRLRTALIISLSALISRLHLPPALCPTRQQHSIIAFQSPHFLFL